MGLSNNEKGGIMNVALLIAVGVACFFAGATAVFLYSTIIFKRKK
jgi:hypothetical protein